VRLPFAIGNRGKCDPSMAAVRAPEESLPQTDWLIDQIVYRLYGLTAEEVAIVEESFV